MICHLLFQGNNRYNKKKEEGFVVAIVSPEKDQGLF
mgnify:CR=1 FL=1|jgi:hypothetical protein